MDVGNEFASDFGAADPQQFRPTESVAGRNDQFAGIETAFDGGGGINFEAAVGNDFADQTPLEHGFPDQRVGIQDVALFFDNQTAVGTEVF